MAHYDVDTTCKKCGRFISIHPCETDRTPVCDVCRQVEKGSANVDMLKSNHNCLKCFDKYSYPTCPEPLCPKEVEIHETYGSELANPLTSLDKQVDGDHYKKYPIQPAKYSYVNKLGWHEGEIIKYVTRHRDKKGKIDLEKAIHLLEMLIELEYEN